MMIDLEQECPNSTGLPILQYLVSGQKGPQPSDQRWIGVGTGNSEVISVRIGEKIVGLGNAETKKLNRVWDIYTCTLRNPYPDMKRGGEGEVVSVTGRKPTLGVIA